MGSIKGTKTEQNLLKAFAGESQARNRYTYAASVAKRGIRTDRCNFSGNCRSGKTACKTIFRFLEGGMVK